MPENQPQQTEKFPLIYQGIEVTPKNCRDILKQVVVSEKEVDKYDYEFRKAILSTSNGEIFTYEAYTKNPEVLERGDDKVWLKNYVSLEENWLPERRAIHQKLISQQYNLALKLSETLPQKNTVYLLRGNTASGKTYSLKRDPRFKDVAKDEQGNIIGTLNPDNFKTLLKHEDQINGKNTENDAQVHQESSLLCSQLETRIFSTPDVSMIFDKRYDKKRDIQDVLTNSKNTNRTLEIRDMETPLLLSAIRVLTRPIDGPNPRVPIDPVAEGFKGIRTNRPDLIALAHSDHSIRYYVLSERGDLLVDEVWIIEDGIPKLTSESNQESFNRIVNVWSQEQIIDEEIYVVKNLNISHENINKWAQQYNLKEREIETLMEYLKYPTIKITHALEEHSKRIK